MNYADLTQAILDYTESYEQTFIDNVPLFVQQCEERVYNAVQIPAIRKNQVGNFTQSDKYLALPPDYLASFSMAVILADGSQEFLIDKDVNFIRQAYPNPTDEGIPRYYAQFEPYTYIIGPTPDDNYDVELHYYYYPESIVTAGTSWLGDNFETVLLYGSLREAVIFQKGEQDMVAYYEQKYQESLALLKELGDGKDRRSAYRDGQLKLPVPGPVR
jgi:hypothetical protein